MPERDPLAEARDWLTERQRDRGFPRTFEVIVVGMREAEVHVAALVERVERHGRQVAAARHFLAAWQDGGGADAATCDAALLLAEALAAGVSSADAEGR